MSEDHLCGQKKATAGCRQCYNSLQCWRMWALSTMVGNVGAFYNDRECGRFLQWWGMWALSTIVENVGAFLSLKNWVWMQANGQDYVSWTLTEIVIEKHRFRQLMPHGLSDGLRYLRLQLRALTKKNFTCLWPTLIQKCNLPPSPPPPQVMFA